MLNGEGLCAREKAKEIPTGFGAVFMQKSNRLSCRVHAKNQNNFYAMFMQESNRPAAPSSCKEGGLCAVLMKKLQRALLLIALLLILSYPTCLAQW